MLWFKRYVFVLPDGRYLEFMGQTDVRIESSWTTYPKMSSNMIFGALVKKIIF